jgi:hypothetical protein
LQNREEKRVKVLWILDELWIPNPNTADACQEFANRIKPYLERDPNLIVKIYGDPAGSARQTAAGPGAKSDWEIVRREMQRLRKGGCDFIVMEYVNGNRGKDEAGGTCLPPAGPGESDRDNHEDAYDPA